ncbi:MAG: response regulator transcription factor, partial [Pseudomonadota bacterium]
MLPGMSGLEITRWIRSREDFNVTPILMVTAKVEPEHIAAGLDAGADDYLPKPFDTLVLMARVNALMRRHQWLGQNTEAVSSSVITVGALELKPDQYEIALDGEKMELTKSEYKLLECLMSHQGKVLSRESLIKEIQGDGVNVVGRTVDTHVFGLRKKLGVHSEMIETIRGIGYRVKYQS